MKAKFNETIIELATGDITLETTDAIVNAANERLAGGAGVDGAIHRAGGPDIMAECRRIGGCPTGQAVITTGGRLAARFVIHTVGPIYRGGTKNEARLLSLAYQNSLTLAATKGLQSISFPAISCGIYGYPIHEAASVALSTCIEYARKNSNIKLIRHILFDRGIFEVFNEEFKKLI
ncbi:MAG TPA: O-acetyl-ADP-ribose deacetylase [Smithellaceae bacterium]|jgi:O-acetyl-ADP-ribose deacetylase (regulator of RNase III)|nr:O-acetyl-ADP-ribose deacetylase [Syntrophaceae bacterium]HPL97213.1 O-acetyl-ADP-ribose deacetylase [Smithellaceae bacterium]HPV48617.1 O-acetyl-ADP-ribose deacetylase [Smithellaceae bacterium]